MTDGPAAYQIMKYLSLGIKNSDLLKIDMAENSMNYSIYTNEEYDISFNYPSNMNITDDSYAINSEIGKYFNGIKLDMGNIEIRLGFFDLEENTNWFYLNAPTSIGTYSTEIYGNLTVDKFLTFASQVEPEGTWILLYFF